MECPECGSSNREDAHYCELCYHRFAGESKTGELSADSFSSTAGLPALPVLEHASAAYRTRVNRNRKIAWALITCVSVAAVALLLAFPLLSRDKRREGLKEYDSKVSPLTFKYPESWERKDRSDVKGFLKDLEDNPTLGNETILMKRGAAIFRHMLIVTSRQEEYGSASWKEIEESIRRGLEESSGSQGLEMRFFHLDLPYEAAANGMGISSFIEGASQIRVFQLEGFVLKNNASYTFTLLTPLLENETDQGEARLVFNDIINTIRFSR